VFPVTDLTLIKSFAMISFKSYNYFSKLLFSSLFCPTKGSNIVPRYCTMAVYFFDDNILLMILFGVPKLL
jgi:hypothetical protein